MNEYQALTPEIQVPKEWTVDGIKNIVEYLVQDAINCHRSGKKFVMTVGNVPAMIKDNGTKPGYVFKKIKEIKNEDTCKIDLIIPARITILKRTNIGPNDKKEEAVEYLPMNLKFDHPIAKFVSTNPDRHTVMTIVPDVEKILLLKGIVGSEKYNYTLRTTYRVHNIKWLDDTMSDMETGESTAESFIVNAHQISKNKWDIVGYNRPPQPQ
ncbi:GSCOCT00013425001.2-RA-CDS [Cotesia congregata]|uniref:Cc_bv12.3_4.1a n=2 Tax=root TaxID=1 RepID=S6D326_COTCN|nr:hypothetical protein CcBV_4.1b [Bracoviriform congregatae]CAD6244698.1 GSCOCT00013425001.2-RA-CDS [Cotesia congregata]CAG17402.1 hypothetical protein CcBV_4.1b [Bracoviriform congregatae]CAG5075866.1 cc_bv12.3_4.1a [Cotesia congregata]CCQ71363.1 hypothetical protein BV12-3 [Cotesia congregata]